MKVALAIVALLAAWPLASRAASPSCETFTRSSATAPAMVRAWLAGSTDVDVRICTMPPATGAATARGGVAATPGAEDLTPVYSGESAVVRDGTVCSYSSHGLIGAGSGAKRRLQRYERGETIGMALAGGDCPAPHPAAGEAPYVTTYELSPAAFVSIMQLWGAIAASPAAFDRETCCEARSGSAEVRRRLRAGIEAGRMRSAHVARIVRLSMTVLHRRYALFVVDPDARPTQPPFYVIYLSRRLGGPFHITGIADAPS